MKQKIGIHAFVWVGGWSEEECRQALESSRTSGYDLIEIPLLEPAAIDVALTRSLLEKTGLEATCTLALTPETDISSTDEAVVARGERLLHDALAVARDLGATYLGGVIFGALTRYREPLAPAGRLNSMRVLARLAEQAAASGMQLGLEVVNRYESNFLNTAEQALSLIEEIGAPNLVVHLDTYHMNIEEENFVKPVVACGKRLGYVHVGESHRGYLGTGTVDFPAFFRALRQAGYQGPITFESFSRAQEIANLSGDLAIWRYTWTDRFDLARHARAFIAAGLEAADTPED
ncbi:epimerase [Thermogemmatispora aurantia]|uniref:sugar phosphate isomerase/epimerase family protein n=1 Tax=Thermogemmatispora aurantia TaxID=2045279 RepID=UPI00124BD144|nr:sugar phosphate isomerase/epimerase [Thermogemmatispora aurantia]GER84526.1 epimerase [Thermogemmatispora aurantia]